MSERKNLERFIFLRGYWANLRKIKPLFASKAWKQPSNWEPTLVVKVSDLRKWFERQKRMTDNSS